MNRTSTNPIPSFPVGNLDISCSLEVINAIQPIAESCIQASIKKHEITKEAEVAMAGIMEREREHARKCDMAIQIWDKSLGSDKLNGDNLVEIAKNLLR